MRCRELGEEKVGEIVVNESEQGGVKCTRGGRGDDALI